MDAIFHTSLVLAQLISALLMISGDFIISPLMYCVAWFALSIFGFKPLHSILM